MAKRGGVKRLPIIGTLEIVRTEASLAQERAVQGYEHYLEDVKWMLTVARRSMECWHAQKPLTGDSRADVRLCYLMLRLITESMMLASLLVHDTFRDDIRKKFPKKWHAGKIIKEIEKQNPNWFPRPVTLRASAPLAGPPTLVWYDHIDLRETEGCITKEELEDLYSTCGRILHAPGPTNMELRSAAQRATQAVEGIASLLERHMIYLSDEVTLVVEMEAEGGWQGRVQAVDLHSE
ncbi:MAG: hypothetical protein OXI05_01180 [Bacteroidota bacterium]|nr:hypothetical protein [Bacteroidota bacterium]